MAEKKFAFVRSIYGSYVPELGENKKTASTKYEYIPDGGMNQVIKEWNEAQPSRPYTVASPSSLTTCPRVIWLATHRVPKTNDMTWATKQRLLLGRLFEDKFAEQLMDANKLIFHWKDDPGIEVKKFKRGEGLDRIEGVPDYLIYLDSKCYVSDAKTSRSDSFGYVEISFDKVWKDWGWYKYKLQLTAYYMLCHANADWFKKNRFPLPEGCHLFSYALDDGLVRREYSWQPTEEDMKTVIKYARRFNAALIAEECPDCTCKDTPEQFDMKFCKYAEVPEGTKIGIDCCQDKLINQAA